MTGRDLLERALEVLLVVVVLSLVLGQFLGQPILLGYVATGSMEPTMDAGDGFVAIPSAVAGSVEEGDVVVFEARTLHDGGLTTHRVVDETEQGYVTKGDGNPFTDQDGGEPPVTDAQIVAVALQVNGEVVTVPYLGTVVLAVHGAIDGAYGSFASTLGLSESAGSEGMGAMLVGIGVALLGFGFLFDRAGPSRRDVRRSTARENVIAVWAAIGLVLIVLVTLATAAMVLPSGVLQYGIVSDDAPSDDPQVVAPGETTALTRTVDNAGFVPVVVVLEPASPGVEVEPERTTVGSRSSAEASIRLTAPEETGTYSRHVNEHRYLALLPPSVVGSLHAIHPLAAIAAVDAVIVGVTVAVMLLVFGPGDLRLRTAGRHVPLWTRLQRKIRKWL